MTKAQLCRRLASKFKINHTLARLIVDAFFDSITVSVFHGEKVILRGFGTFSLKITKDRLSRNPHTGEKIFVASKKSMTFKAGRSLHLRLNPTDEQK